MATDAPQRPATSTATDRHRGRPPLIDSLVSEHGFDADKMPQPASIATIQVAPPVIELPTIPPSTIPPLAMLPEPVAVHRRTVNPDRRVRSPVVHRVRADEKASAARPLDGAGSDRRHGG